MIQNLASRLLAACISLVAGLYLAWTAAGAIESASANSIPANTGFTSLTTSSDTIYNWDFDGTSASSGAVDWGVRFIFKSNAEIDYVKNRLDGVGSDPSISPQLDDDGGTKYGYVDDGPEKFFDSVWDNDDGIKEGLSCDVGWDWGHMRLYARTSSDRNYNIVWGYYVIGTNHQDFENGDCDVEYRSYESHEEMWEDRFDVLAGSHSWSYAGNYQSLQNAFYNTCSPGCGIGYYVDLGGNNHDYSSDGLGTSVWVN